MIIVKSPLRVSFFGGGTDMPKFFREYGGEVISCTINKYIYTSIKKLDHTFEENFRLNYSTSERVQNIKDIKNNIIRESLKLMQNKHRLYISTIADVPLRSGLGSSSSFTASLISGLYKLNDNKISKNELAKLACKLEIDILKSPIGYQDQFATVYGGLNRLSFTKQKTTVKKINLENTLIKKFEESMLLVFTGIQRDGNVVLKKQNIDMNSKIESYKEMKKISLKAYKYLKNAKAFDVNYFSTLLNDNWNLKKELTIGVENETTKSIIKSLKKSGASGLKLCGAGGGGFILICAEKSAQKKILKDHKTFNFYNFGISFEGTRSAII